MKIALVSITLIMLLATSANAVTTGTISGSVTDPAGASVAQAQVTVLNEGTNETRSMITSASGSFEFLLLSVGTYTLKIEHPNFKLYAVHTILLTVNQVARFDVKLELGSIMSIVNVDATAVQVDTASTQIGTVIGSRPILDLPLNGRDVYQLVILQPGISSADNATGNPAISGGSGGPTSFSSGGGRLTMNNFMVDGTDTNGGARNEAVVKIIPDAVEEFRVLTNSFNAEFGRNAGSVVNVISKSGTNQWHATIFEFFRNEVLNARNFFELNRAPFKLNQFGGAGGGPLRKDKTFVLGSFQASRRRQGLPGTSQRVFSDAERNGDFSGRNPGGFTGSLTDAMCFPRDSANPANCFAAGTPYSSIFPGGIIPSSFFDPISQNIVTTFLPHANVGGQFFSSSPVQPENEYQSTLKVDQNFKSHKLAAFYFLDDDAMTSQLGSVPGFPVVSGERDQQINLSDTWIISPTTLNEGRVSYLRQSKGKERSPLRVIPVASLGFTGITPGEPASLQSLPAIKISGGPRLQAPGTGSGGGFDVQNVFQVADNFSKVVGVHTLRFGADIRRIHFDEELVFDFDGEFDFGGSGPNSTGDPFANFVLGLPATYFQGSAQFERLRSTQYNLYGQDSWRIRPNLTLNYGLRWELNTPFIEANNELEAYRFPRPGQPAPQSVTFPTAPTGYLFPGDSGVPRGLTQTYFRSFAPRIGLAYSPKWFGANKTVIRSSYGIFYNPVEQFALSQFNGTPPFGGSSFVPSPGFANPFTTQSGGTFPNPYPFSPPKPGTSVDFSKFFPILMFGNLLPNQRSQYAEQYNLVMEYQISSTTLFSGGYVGSQGHRLLASFDANPGNPSLCLKLLSQGCGPFGEDSNYVDAAGQTIFGTRPAGVFSHNSTIEAFSNIFTQDSIANSNYNSLQARLERQGTDLQFLASYTYSKSIDNASGFENILNPFCFSCERTLSGFDARHRFVFSSTYRLPFGRHISSNTVLKKLADGWEVGGIYTFQTGIPVRLSDGGSDNSLTGGFDFEPIDRPDLVGPIHIRDPHKDSIGASGAVVPNLFFDPSAFAVESLGRVGNASRNIFPGPHINNWDFTTIKWINLSERMQVQFRAEFFNLFNHTQFQNPTGDISAGDDFGRVTSARDPRFVQFGLKVLF